MELIDPLASPPRTPPPTTTVEAVDLELSFLKRAVEAPLCKDLGVLDDFTLDGALEGLTSSAPVDDLIPQTATVTSTSTATAITAAVATSKPMFASYTTTTETNGGGCGTTSSNGTLLRTAGSSQLRIATRAAKPRTYQDATPSKHCHICSARPSKPSPHMVCANLGRGTCRKTVCAKCFAKHGWDLHAARANPRHWVCPHCRNMCPRAAQCFIYGRTTERRRKNAQRARAAARATAGGTSDRVAVAARRAALLAAEQIVRAAHSGEWAVGGEMCTVASNGAVEPLGWVGAQTKVGNKAALEMTPAQLTAGNSDVVDISGIEVGAADDDELFGELFV